METRRTSDGQTCKGTAEQRAFVKHKSFRYALVDPNSEIRGDPKEIFEDKIKSGRTRMEETDRFHRPVRAQGTSVEVVTEDRGPHQPPGFRIRKASHISEDSAEPRGQVQKFKKKGRNPKGHCIPSGSDAERADPDFAERISNKIRSGKFGTRSSTPALRKTDFTAGKRRLAN